MSKTRIAREVDEILASKPRQGSTDASARGEAAYKNIQSEARAAEREVGLADNVQASYVKLKGLRGFDAYAVQLPSHNRWGFELAMAKGEWSQSWPGGLGLATEWTAVPKAEVPKKVRAEMDWLLDQ